MRREGESGGGEARETPGATEDTDAFNVLLNPAEIVCFHDEETFFLKNNCNHVLCKAHVI